MLSAYKNRDARVWYMYMLASDDLGQAMRRFGYFKNLSGEMKDEARRILQAREELEEEKEKLSKMKKEAEAVKAERVKELEKLRKIVDNIPAEILALYNDANLSRNETLSHE